MADNIIINAPTVPGGQIVASDDVGGVQHELVKVEFGTDGNATMVSTGNPLPVTDAVAEAALASIAGEDFATQATLLNIYNKLLASIAVTIASLPLPAGAAISANQQTDALTNTQLRLTPVPVSGTITVDTSLLATSAKQDTGNASLASILAKIIAAPSTEAKQDTIITALATLLTISDFDTKTGSLTETAPATDTASSGLNGRLQRIAQRLTSLIALLPAALGAGGGLKIDGSGTALPISGSITANAGTNLNTSLLALESGGNLANILTKLTAAAASFVKLEDSASADADAGVPAFAVRKATPANSSGTDGDYEPLQMNAGKLWVQAGATQKPSYGTEVVGTVTNLQSLATSVTAGWQSDRISNTSTLATDYEIFFKLTTANTAPSSSKTVQIFICPFYTTDGGTTWFATSGGTATLPSGTQGTYTIASPNDLILGRVLNYTTQQMILQGSFLLSNVFGTRMPDGFSVILINDTGASFSTGCLFNYKPISDILV